MSAHGQEMERQHSAPSILTRAGSGSGSERGSHYNTESGIFMSSFAATIFISGLATFGISVLSLLIALMAMLKSCESRNSGVIETYRSTHNYDYCRSFAQHAELNQLGTNSLPAACEDINVRYIREGQYVRDLNATIGIAEEFFASIRPISGRRDAVIMDADDLLAAETSFPDMLSYWTNKDSIHNINRYANYLKCNFCVKLYIKLQSTGWQLILFSRRPEKMQNATVDHLMSLGCRGWSSLIMRADSETQVEFQHRTMRQRGGFRTLAVISSRLDTMALGGQHGDRVFKLPNPIFKYDTKNPVDE